MPTKRATAPPADRASRADTVLDGVGDTAEVERVARTWLDAMPAGAARPGLDDLLTRRELLEEVRKRGHAVSEGSLRFWERTQLLPRPVRRHRDGAGFALYPSWAAPAVTHVAELRAAGKTLEQIAPVMKAWAVGPVLWRDDEARPRAAAGAALAALARVLGIVEAASAEVVYRDGEGHTLATAKIILSTAE